MILGSELTHGLKLSSLMCLIAACEDLLGLPSSTRMSGPGVTTDPKVKRSWSLYSYQPYPHSHVWA